MGDVVEPLGHRQQLDRDTAAFLRGRVEPFLGQVENMVHDERFGADQLVEDGVEATRSYLQFLLRGDRDGEVNVGAVLPALQTLTELVAPFLPADEPGAEIGTTLAHGPDEEPDPATAVADANTIADGIDPERIDEETTSVYRWLAERLGWTRAATMITGAAGGAVVGGADAIGGVLDALGVAGGPWAPLIGAVLGLLSTAWVPRAWLDKLSPPR